MSAYYCPQMCGPLRWDDDCLCCPRCGFATYADSYAESRAGRFD